MKIFCKKLKSSRGASIMMALVLLLVAMTVSVIVVTSAVSAAKNVSDTQGTQQLLLTVTSATELLRDSIIDDSYKNVERKFVKLENGETVTRYTHSDVAASNYFAALLNEAVNAPKPYTKTFRIIGTWTEGSGSSSVQRTLLPVEVVFSMDASYNISARLTLVTYNGRDCRMYLSARGRVSTPVVENLGENASGEDVTETTITISWFNAEIGKKAS